MQETMKLDYRDFVGRLKAARGSERAQVLYLPARRLRLEGVPPEVLREYHAFCTSTHV